MNKFSDNQSTNLIISFIVTTSLVNPVSKAGAKWCFVFFTGIEPISRRNLLIK